MDMRSGILNVRSLYRAGALGLVTSELDRCRMDLVGEQEVRLEGSGTLESGNYNYTIIELFILLPIFSPSSQSQVVFVF